MRALLEEYGGTLVVIFAVAVVMGIGVFIGAKIKSGTETAVDKFTTNTDKVLNEQLSGGGASPTATPGH